MLLSLAWKTGLKNKYILKYISSLDTYILTRTLCLSGESGLGKSTLINSLFLTDLYSPEYPGPSHRIKKTVQVILFFFFKHKLTDFFSSNANTVWDFSIFMVDLSSSWLVNLIKNKLKHDRLMSQFKCKSLRILHHRCAVFPQCYRYEVNICCVSSFFMRRLHPAVLTQEFMSDSETGSSALTMR